MLSIKNVLFLGCLLTVTTATAQLSYGFRAGLSFAEISGDSETDDAGNALEEFKFANGFHIGFSLNYAFTDLFGVRGELLFTQRGTKYTFDGDSYYFLARRTVDQRVLLGHRLQDYNISMASFEIPLIAYYKFGGFEISGGLNAAIIMTSTGGGTITFDGIAPSGAAVDPFEIQLQYNFNKDEAQGYGPPPVFVKVDNSLFETPGTIGAYYQFEEKNGNKYGSFDLGLTVGLAFYLNEGLYIGGRFTYGLLDADDNQYDISLHKLGQSNSYIYRDDINRHIGIQASLGFLF